MNTLNIQLPNAKELFLVKPAIDTLRLKKAGTIVKFDSNARKRKKHLEAAFHISGTDLPSGQSPAVSKTRSKLQL
jgi:hypothetical protein